MSSNHHVIISLDSNVVTARGIWFFRADIKTFVVSFFTNNDRFREMTISIKQLVIDLSVIEIYTHYA